MHVIQVTKEEEESYGVQEGELLGADMEEALVGDGEIDWDCPCLQGMAQGTCGENFKAAFSCFVTSSAEPKGSDCVEYFVAMRDCMIANPSEYPDLNADSETAGEETAAAPAAEAEAPAASAAAATEDDAKPASTTAA